MSLKAIAQVLNDTEWDSSTHLLVAISVANFCGPRGLCFAHYSTLARFSRLNERTVGRTIRDLISAGKFKAYRKKRLNGTLGGYVLEIPGTGDDRYREDGQEQQIVDAESSDAGTSGPLSTSEDQAASPNRTQLPRSNQRLSEPDLSQQEDAASLLVTVAFDEWNTLAKSEGLPVAEKLTEDRKRKLTKRLKDSGIEGWRRALSAIPRAKFLVGEARPRDGEAPFRAHIDFVLQARSFQKLVEGGYGQDRKPKVTPETIAPAYQERLRTDERFARTMAHQWTQDPDRWPPEAGPAPGQPGCVLSPEIQCNVAAGYYREDGAWVGKIWHGRADDEVPL